MFANGWFFMRMRSWYRASFCEKHCICCRLRISWSIRLGAQRYESLLALSSALLPLNTGDWVLDIRPSGHHIHTHHTLTHTHTHRHVTHILPRLRVMASSHITHHEKLETERGNIWFWDNHIKFVIKLIKPYISIFGLWMFQVKPRISVSLINNSN